MNIFAIDLQFDPVCVGLGLIKHVDAPFKTVTLGVPPSKLSDFFSPNHSTCWLIFKQSFFFLTTSLAHDVVRVLPFYLWILCPKGGDLFNACFVH